MKKIWLTALILAVLAAPAARTQDFEPNLAPQTVIGNPNSIYAPASAIPFAQLASSVTAACAGKLLCLVGSVIVPVRSASASTVTASATTDYFLCLDPTSNAITVDLPASPTTGLSFLVKDCTGQAGTNNITITPASGNVDGQSTFILSTNYQSVAVTYTGAQWSLN